MKDETIVDLFWRREESAIAETRTKYGRYLTKIAYRILGNLEDCEECVNDTYLKAWNSIPPQRPKTLPVYFGKITRQTAIDCYRRQTSVKRGGAEFEASLDELEECIPAGSTIEIELDGQMLSSVISQYLYTLPQDKRMLFIRRYFYCDSVKVLAKQNGCSQSKIKSTLFRMRAGLKEYLEKEGFVI